MRTPQDDDDDFLDPNEEWGTMCGRPDPMAAPADAEPEGPTFWDTYKGPTHVREPDPEPGICLPLWHETSRSPNAITSSQPILQCGLFGADQQAPRAPVVVRYPTLFGPDIEYRGPRLTGFHLRVLGALLKMGEGLPTNVPYTMLTRSFAHRNVELSDNRNSKRNCVTAIKDLRGAWGRFPVYNGLFWDRHSAFLLSDYQELETPSTDKGFPTKIAVAFDPKIVALFTGPQSRLYLNHLNALSSGLQTWIYTLVRSHHFDKPLLLERLREFSGYARGRKEFRKELRTAMNRLVDLEQVHDDWSFTSDGCLSCHPTWRRRPKPLPQPESLR